jgi:hypothetical protein
MKLTLDINNYMKINPVLPMWFSPQLYGSVLRVK